MYRYIKNSTTNYIESSKVTEEKLKNQYYKFAQEVCKQHKELMDRLQTK